ncbi:MAG: Rid family hydrolase, partial [Betaproteobacteria bacterium]
ACTMTAACPAGAPRGRIGVICVHNDAPGALAPAILTNGFHIAMKMVAHTPSGIAPPAALYVHGMEIPANARWLFISGQIGAHPDGRIGADAREQAEIIWHNIAVILRSADMAVSDIVKLTSYAVGPRHLPALREVRERVLAGHLPASTLLLVAGLARPELLVEVEVYAAKV